MNTASMRNNGRRAGFTVPEVLVASAIGGIVTLGVMTTFIWSGKQASLCTRIAWSQMESMRTSGKLTMYLRNAREIVDIDEVEGRWVRLRFPDHSIGTLAYSNAVPDQRDGRLYLLRDDGSEVIVARGLTEIQDDEGFTTPVFRKVRGNALSLAYRVAEPVRGGGRDADDGAFAACVRFSACLRNAEEVAE